MQGFLELRLCGQHSQSPVDRLAGDRLAVAEELADLPDRAPGRAEVPGGLHLPGCQPVLAAAVPAAGRGSGQAVPGALADEVALELGERGQDREEQLALTL
jgi:hypothetical protein